MYNKCLKIQMNKLGFDSIHVANTLNNKASIMASRSEYGKALEQYNKCLEIRMKKLGADSVQVATTFSNIGIVHYDRGEYE